jgi:peptidoglycan/xylan/chitin deacetylase (PgdA/CDA1 family)
MEIVSRTCQVLPLQTAVQRLREQTLPPRAACITFDDGYADNCDVALPILQEFALPATFFISTGFLDGGCMWNDLVLEAFSRSDADALDLSSIGLGTISIASPEKRADAASRALEVLKYKEPGERLMLAQRLIEESGVAVPDAIMMSSEQVRILHQAGMEVGAHTETHPILCNLNEGTARSEIENSKCRLEEIIEAPVRFFAYPNGKPEQDYTTEHVKMVKDLGFEAALSTIQAVATRGSDPFQLPRFTPWDRMPLKWGLRLLDAYRRTEVEA